MTKLLTFEEIKNLKEDDFETSNELVWKSIENLSNDDFFEIIRLWDDESISESIQEMNDERVQKIIFSLFSKVKKTFKKHYNKLSEKEKSLFEYANEECLSYLQIIDYLTEEKE